MLSATASTPCATAASAPATIFKALALGARTVLLGRPYVHVLPLEGRPGAEHVICTLLAGFKLTLALAGFTTPQSLTRDALVLRLLFL
ncbi:hypothetical protein GCM10010218_01380 [Streptomyces mashuensis]|uniref:FMN-dependent dehydrogenase domain-containing protein n=1 Tax=Streptomyces mashuensis TaxID=33904 RepID=A0A919E888_9ACTN|nr:hypothetical protein GCM10010218_01380 [Streptomyces mashuensis]